MCNLIHREECKHFAVDEPNFSLADELGEDLESHEKMWQLYEDFSNELEQLSSQDWISFR